MEKNIYLDEKTKEKRDAIQTNRKISIRYLINKKEEILKESINKNLKNKANIIFLLKLMKKMLNSNELTAEEKKALKIRIGILINELNCTDLNSGAKTYKMQK